MLAFTTKRGVNAVFSLHLTGSACHPHHQPVNLSDSQTGGRVPRRVSAMEAVLAHLRAAIENGEYAIGEKLPSEAELCRTLEVSRPVLREALRALQTMGLTVSKTGKGTFVVAIVEALVDGSEHDAVEAMSHHLDRVETTLTDIVRSPRTDTPTEGGPEA